MEELHNTMVSVIIPTYNRASILSKAIESVIKQTYKNLTIIVVDDGSTDNTKELMASYPQVKYIHQKNGGPGRARNLGLQHAVGTYIASLDSDDTWEPEFLERCIGQLEKDKSDFVFANWTQVVSTETQFDFFGTSKMLDKYIEVGNEWVSLDNAKLREIYLSLCPSPTSSLVIRRTSLYDKWQEGLNIGDDWCLLLDMILRKGCKAAFTLRRLWVKTVDGKNIYDGRSENEILELLYINDLHHIFVRHKSYLTESERKALGAKVSSSLYTLFTQHRNGLKQSKNNGKLLNIAITTHPHILFNVFRFHVRRIRRASVKIAATHIKRIIGRKN